MKNRQYVVAIGASAGGLEALSAFFEHTPLDSVSYIIILHLSPDFKSRMVEILARHTQLEVLEAAEGMEVEINKVYLIPSTKYMGIKKGKLFLNEKEGQRTPHLTIDAFFTSLAEERGNKSIAVILSGAGSDGAKGSKAIESAGGIVMVQEPENAKFDGMPNAAIANTNPDYILTAEAMPIAIQQYVHADLNVGHSEVNPPTFSEYFIADVVNLIRDQFPYDFTDYKIPTLVRRIKRRMIHLNLTEEAAFFSYLEKTPAELELLISDFLVGVTSFFRDPEAFHILENEVIPQIIEQKSAKDYIKIWVACCATGEEAYSLGILVQEYLVRNRKKIEVKIFATDINRVALNQAAKGVFAFNISKTVSEDRLSAFFDKGEDNYIIKPEIRKMIIFAHHDLTKNPPYVDVDLITCRNMLIYIKPVLQKQVLEKLTFGLRKDGFLFLGSSENIPVLKNDFMEVSAKWKIFQNKKDRKPFRLQGPFATAINDVILNNQEKFPFKKNELPPPALSPDFTEVVLKESGFSGLSITEQGDVTQTYGDLSAYLKKERFQFKLKELLPETLSVAFSGALNQVLKLNQKVRINNIVFKEPGSTKKRAVDLIISPFGDRRTPLKGMLVLFKPVVNKIINIEGEDFKLEQQTKLNLLQLEDDLLSAKKELSVSNELLESSKEAMQTFNEELLSANEELQSANEELQSINEELETVNAEHQYTINELSNLNDDLNNYFRSNINGQLFVDTDILLKKYSPGAVKHINIRESDIGRPLSNITTNIKFETLVDDIRKVIDTGEIIIQEIESNEGKIYQVMTSPYTKQTSKETYGAIITFYDITELKKTQKDLDSNNAMLRLATESAEMGTWSINIQTREYIVSPRINELYGFYPDDEMIYENVIGQIVQEQRGIVSDMVERSIKSDGKIDTEHAVIGFRDGKLRWVRSIGNVTHNKAGKPEYLTGVSLDITEKKLSELRKSDFLSIASHELKTPLTSLQAIIQMLNAKAKKAEDTFSSGAFDQANKQLKKITALINSFLTVSRLEAGKISLNKEKFDIKALIEETLHEVKLLNPFYNFTLNSVSKTLIHADREKIGSVLTNLLSNAVKYSPKGKNIEISCKRVENTLQIEIKDEGVGIDLMHQKKLFDRYYRVESTQTQTISGFGIGLYLSAEIIKLHQGKIWVESKKGQGSTFIFDLPIN